MLDREVGEVMHPGLGATAEAASELAQALPAGVNMAEPLVRDGVLYSFGYGDQVFAFDAATGRSLWRYQRRVPEGTQLNSSLTLGTGVRVVSTDKMYSQGSLTNTENALDMAVDGQGFFQVLMPDGRDRKSVV